MSANERLKSHRQPQPVPSAPEHAPRRATPGGGVKRLVRRYYSEQSISAQEFIIGLADLHKKKDYIKLARDVEELDNAAQLLPAIAALPRYACIDKNLAQAIDEIWYCITGTRAPDGSNIVAQDTLLRLVERRLGAELGACEELTWETNELDGIMRGAAVLPLPPAVYGFVDNFKTCGPEDNIAATYSSPTGTIEYKETSVPHAQPGASHASEASHTVHEVGHAVHARHPASIDSWLVNQVGFVEITPGELGGALGLGDISNDCARIENALASHKIADIRRKFPDIPEALLDVYLQRGPRTAFGNCGTVIGSRCFFFEPYYEKFMLMTTETVRLAQEIGSDYALKAPGEFFAESFRIYHTADKTALPSHLQLLMQEVLRQAEGEIAVLTAFDQRLTDDNSFHENVQQLGQAVEGRQLLEPGEYRALTADLGLASTTDADATALALARADDHRLSPATKKWRFSIENAQRIRTVSQLLWHEMSWTETLTAMGYPPDELAVFAWNRTVDDGGERLNAVINEYVLSLSGHTRDFSRVETWINDKLETKGVPPVSLSAQQAESIDALRFARNWSPDDSLVDKHIGPSSTGTLFMLGVAFHVETSYYDLLAASGSLQQSTIRDATRQLVWWLVHAPEAENIAVPDELAALLIE